MIRRILFALFLVLFLAAGAAAAEKTNSFEPVPANLVEAYRFDLTGNFYPDEAAWQKDMDTARSMVDKLESYRGRLLESPKDLLGYMDIFRDFTDLRTKLYAYGEFVFAIDTEDRGPYEAYLDLMADQGARTSFARVELLSLSPETFEKWLKEEPRLLPYRYRIEDIIRMAPHTLGEKEEAILAKTGPDRTSWQTVLFQKAFDGTRFPTILANGKELDVHLHFGGLLRNSDPAVRERAFKEYYAKLDALSGMAGFGLLRLMRATNDEASLRGFDTYYNQSLFERYLSREQIDNLYRQMEANLPLYHDYQRYRMEGLQAQYGLPKASFWDMDMPLGGATPPRYDIVSASELILASLSVLGPEYSRETAALLDPENGRLDIVGGPGRDMGAFCEGNFGFFMDNYQGYLTHVSTLSHEAGHAIHHQVELNHQGSLLFGDGPSFMTESFSMFNEWLLRDYILKNEKDPELLKSYRNDALYEMAYVWELARRAKFEMISYDRAADGTIKDAAGFDTVCLEVGNLYDLFFKTTPELKVHWMRKHHYWSVPTYYINYVVAHVLALTYYQRYLEDPEGFSKRYVEMQAAGFDRPAAQLLKDFLDIDMNDPALLEGTFKLIRSRLNSLRGEN